MPFFLIPYALQLICVVHALKNGKNTYWIWIIVFVPYIGGLAYLIVEILPTYTNANRIDLARNTLIDFIKPNQRFEIVKQKAEFSASYKNMIGYADVLLERKEYIEALKIYENENAGVFKDDQELLYRIALANYYCGNYQVALSIIQKLFSEDEKKTKKSRECLLYLQILEKTENREKVKDAYYTVNQRIQNNSIEIPFLNYLIENKEYEEAKKIIERVHNDEKSMRINNVRYNKTFYREVYRLERLIAKKDN
jgi:hypothetical protein